VYRKYFKRPLDFIMALVGLIVLSPVMLVVAILVRIKLGSPVIFNQPRPGLNEKIFTLYKFRTMTDERDENGELLPDEQRLTPFGKWLRSTSLDELPELWNILKGDMSFVGPRPLSVNYLPYYTSEERLRHSVRPGMTGLAQVNGRNTVQWEKRFALDLDYVRNASLWMDVKIVFKTIDAVLSRRDIGCRGVDAPEDFDEYRKRIWNERSTVTGRIDLASSKEG
jgi:undecaprenyl phosphate N,N'-diacetylbacillosamine 1-phosphate transferase